MLVVLNAVVGVLGSIACLIYGGLALLTFIMSSPPAGADHLPYIQVVLVLSLTALLAAALAGGLVVGVLTWRRHSAAQPLGHWLAGSAILLALLICLTLALAPLPAERASLAKLVMPAVAVAGVYAGLTLAVSLRELIRPVRRNHCC